MAHQLDRTARDFSKIYPVMTDDLRRQHKGLKVASILQEALAGKALNTVLDVGCSSAILLDVVLEQIQSNLAIGVDLDSASLPKASPSRFCVVGNALALPLADETVDLVLCNHTYEHVPDPKKLFAEITRVLKSDGLVYFGAMNFRWPIEPHYKIPFLHWLPKFLSSWILKRLGHEIGYLEQPLGLTQLRKLVRDFEINDYTLKVIAEPQRYKAEDVINPRLACMVNPISKLFYSWLPGYLWVLTKRAAKNTPEKPHEHHPFDD